MLTLGVDTSSDSGSLALVHDAVVLGQREISAEQYSASLLREAAALLAGCRMSFEEIGLYAVNAGPGSFTGLRVGLTTVKAWAEVWGKPVAAVSGLEAMAKQVSNLAAPGSLIAAVTDARRGQVFGGLFRSTTEDSGALAQAGDEVLGTADEFLESLRPRMADGCELVIACFDPELIRSAIEREAMSGCRIEAISRTLAPWIAQLGAAKASRGDVVDALHLDANYIRRSDAEMKWKPN